MSIYSDPTTLDTYPLAEAAILHEKSAAFYGADAGDLAIFLHERPDLWEGPGEDHAPGRGFNGQAKVAAHSHPRPGLDRARPAGRARGHVSLGARSARWSTMPASSAPRRGSTRCPPSASSA